MPRAKQHVLTELRPDQLQAHRETFGKTTRDREAREPGEAGRDREQVARVDGERIRGALADPERHRRRRRTGKDVEPLEGLAVLADDECPHPLRLPVEGVVVPGRKCVRPQHDPPFGLVAEAVVARAVDHLLVARTVGAGPVADAVVTGEVRRGLGRSDEVVAGHAVADGPRKRALSDVRPKLFSER